LSSFSFFTRGSVKEFLVFFQDVVLKKSLETNTIRTSVTKDEYVIHAFLNVNNLCCCITTDLEYGSKSAFYATQLILNNFIDENSNYINKNAIEWPQLNNLLEKYQNVSNIPIINVQNKINETKDILVQTIDAVLERGEKLDDLIEKSAQLSKASKDFYGTSKRMNSCCAIA